MAPGDTPLSDKYEILERLGEGGMGTVYKVRHRLLDEVRVIKTMRGSLRHDEGLTARFLHEARVATQLRHRSIAQIFDFSIDTDDTAYIVMEYIEGSTLEAVTRRVGALSTALVLAIAEPILNALRYLHDKGFVHRDISPDNIMICRDDAARLDVKLIDLGIAKTLDSEQQITATGLFLGKVRYASPEQLEGAGATELDARSDLYSLAVVLYELLTGHFPIRGSSPPSWIAGHLYHPPMGFERSDPDGRVPEPLRRVLLDTLSKDPAGRPENAGILARRLAALRDAHPREDSTERDLLAALDAVSSADSTPTTTLPVDGSARVTTPAPWRDARQLSRAEPTERREASSVLEQIAARVRQQQQREILVVTAEQVEIEVSNGRLTEAVRLLDEAVASYGESDLWATPRSRIEEARAWRMDQRVETLLGDATRCLQSGDLESAGELLAQALDLRPDDTAARQLASELDDALEQQTRQRQLDEAVARIEHALDTGQLEDAARQLERATETFDAEPPLPALHQRLSDLRLDLEIADVVETALELVRSGRLEPACAQLEAADARHPNHPEIRSLLDRTRSEMERRRAVTTAQPAARPADTAERRVEPPEHRGEPTVRVALSTPPVVVAPPVAEAAPSAPSTSKAMQSVPRPWILALALAVALSAVAVSWWLQQPGGGQPAHLPSARVVVDAVPWGTITEIVDHDGRPRTQGLGAVTPVALTLPPGRYRIRLTHPHFEQTVELTVDLPPGGHQHQIGRFTEGSVDELLTALGI